MGEALAEVKKENIEKLLVKETKNQSCFINLVDAILILKSEGNHIEAEKKQQQVDNLIYRLYNLTYNEVKMIDSQIGNKLSEEAYNALIID